MGGGRGNFHEWVLTLCNLFLLQAHVLLHHKPLQPEHNAVDVGLEVHPPHRGVERLGLAPRDLPLERFQVAGLPFELVVQKELVFGGDRVEPAVEPIERELGACFPTRISHKDVLPAPFSPNNTSILFELAVKSKPFKAGILLPLYLHL